MIPETIESIGWWHDQYQTKVQTEHGVDLVTARHLEERVDMLTAKINELVDAQNYLLGMYRALKEGKK